MANLVATSVNGNFTVAGRFTALNHSSKLIRTWSTGEAGSYTWHSLLNTYWSANGWFETKRLYLIWIVSSSTNNYYGYRGWLNTGALGYGGTSQQWIVRGITSASSATPGSCTNSFTSIDNNGFNFAVNNCSETISLFANLQSY